MRKNRLPDAIVIENPRFAAGHLGLPNLEAMNNPNYVFSTAIEGTLEVFKNLGIENENIPLIAAGGIHSHEQVKDLLQLGASAVQVGTAFAVTQEGDAHTNFKTVLAQAKPEDIVTFMSVAGLPARAVLTPWLDSYLHKEQRLQSVAQERACSEGFNCLAHCGLRDGVARSGQFCIDRQLAYALEGDVDRGLFFRGSEPLPFGESIRPVRELIDYLLNGVRPVLRSMQAIGGAATIGA